MRNPLKYLDYHFLLPLIARCPFPLAYRLAEWRGNWMYLARRDSRRHAVSNIKGAFPSMAEAQAKALARRHYQSLSVDEMESLWFSQDSDFFEKYVAVTGLEDLRSAARKPGGALLILGHWASACTLFVAIGRRGVAFHVVGRALERDSDPLHPAHLKYGKRRIADIERAVGYPFLFTGRGNFQRMRELLLAGEIVMIMFDVTPNILRHVRPVQFFGRTAYFADGMVRLQRETGTRVFRGSICRSRRPPYQRIEITEVDVSAIQDGDHLLQQFVSALENEIRERPFQWTLWDSMAWFYQTPGEYEWDGGTGRQEDKETGGQGDKETRG